MENQNEIINFDELDVYLINGNLLKNPKSLHAIHQKSFECWHNVWGDYYTTEHPSGHRLNSDEFTRQDDVLALFYKGECFGITFFREVAWGDPTAPLDSYFELWPETAMKALTSRGNKIIVCSQFTLAHKFRGKNTNIAWKQVLFSFIMKRFLESDAHAMTGTMRVKRGMGKISYEAGAVPIQQEVVYKDHDSESVDLVAFYQHEVGLKYDENPYKHDYDACWDRLNARGAGRLRLVA